jgi:hypothetical protein
MKEGGEKGNQPSKVRDEVLVAAFGLVHSSNIYTLK